MTDSISPDGLDASVPASAPSPTPASRWEDFLDMLYAPSDVYARRANSGFGIPLLVVTLAIGLLGLAMSGALSPIMDAEFHRGAAKMMAKNPQMTEEQLAMGRKIGEKVVGVGAFFIIPIMIFFTGLFLWVVGKLVDAKQTFAAAVMVTAYAQVPRIIGAVLTGVQGLLMDPASLNGMNRLSIGPARFLDPDASSTLMVALMTRLDFFTIWVTVLLAIGLSVTGKVSRQKGAIAAFIVWILGALPALLQAARG